MAVTLDEAIRHCYEVYHERDDMCKECREEHRQLAQWLEELKRLKNADVVEVVRCKDCIHWSRAFGCYRIKKSLSNLPFEPTGFCSYGERRTGNDL